VEFLPAHHELLSRPAKPVSIDTLHSQGFRDVCAEVHDVASGQTAPKGQTRPRRLVGAAAVQFGIDLAFAYVNITEGGEWTDKLRLMINPRVTHARGSYDPVEFWHGCFSAPDLITIVALPRFMTVDYLNEEGRLALLKIDGKHDPRLLHVAWHQINHLRGIRHPDVAAKEDRPVFVVYANEREEFHLQFSAGRRRWRRTLEMPAGWDAMKQNHDWRQYIRETA